MVKLGELGQTITIVNKSGKVVGTSKHLVNVFKEAKAAYRERKAELVAKRRVDGASKQNADRLQRIRLEDDDNLSHASYSVHRRPVGSSPKRHDSSRPKECKSRPSVGERGVTDSFYVNDPPRPTSTRRRVSDHGNPSSSSSSSPKPMRRSATTPMPWEEQDTTTGRELM
ncbi:hypothetical protein LTS18_005744, partial [Coniosporium uncinatum]